MVLAFCYVLGYQIANQTHSVIWALVYLGGEGAPTRAVVTFEAAPPMVVALVRVQVAQVEVAPLTALLRTQVHVARLLVG